MRASFLTICVIVLAKSGAFPPGIYLTDDFGSHFFNPINVPHAVENVTSDLYAGNGPQAAVSVSTAVRQ